jgi:predicted small lipoprotein YifL
MGMKRTAPLLAAVLLVAGCGYKGPLTRLDPADRTRPKEERAAVRAAERAETEAGLRVAADARPVRVDDLTVKLEARGDDPFRLPPEGTRNAREIPFPGDPPAAPPVPAAPPAPQP